MPSKGINTNYGIWRFYRYITVKTTDNYFNKVAEYLGRDRVNTKFLILTSFLIKSYPTSRKVVNKNVNIKF